VICFTALKASINYWDCLSPALNSEGLIVFLEPVALSRYPKSVNLMVKTGLAYCISNIFDSGMDLASSMKSRDDE